MPKVLVIDDMQENLFVISALIRNLIPEYEVLTAQSGFLGMQIATGRDWRVSIYS